MYNQVYQVKGEKPNSLTCLLCKMALFLRKCIREYKPEKERQAQQLFAKQKTETHATSPITHYCKSPDVTSSFLLYPSL